MPFESNFHTSTQPTSEIIITEIKAEETEHNSTIMENIINNKNNKSAAKMQAAATGEKKKNTKSKKKKSTRPKLRPVTTLPAVDEDNSSGSGLGYEDILVVPPPTPRDKLINDLHRLEKELKSLPKFTDEWFFAKEELGLVKLKLDDWDNNTPTAARMTAPIVTTNAAYQDIIKSITDKDEKESQQQSSVVSKPSKKKKKKSSSRKNRPKLKPQSVEKKEEGDEEDGLGFNDILLTKNQSKSSVADERTTLLTDQEVVAPQTQDVVQQSNVVGDWLLRGVIGTLFCFLVFKFLMP